MERLRPLAGQTIGPDVLVVIVLEAMGDPKSERDRQHCDDQPDKSRVCGWAKHRGLSVHGVR